MILVMITRILVRLLLLSLVHDPLQDQFKELPEVQDKVPQVVQDRVLQVVQLDL